jgi:hypothetical protein
MTPQLKLVLLGLGATAISRFYFKKDLYNSITFGLGAISVAAILTVKEDKK